MMSRSVFTWLVFAVALTSFAQPAAPPTEVEILIPASAKGVRPGINSLDLPPGQPGFNELFSPLGPMQDIRGLSSFFPGREMRRITVTRYLASWETEKAVRTKIADIMRHTPEAPMRWKMWAEMNVWTIDASVGFSNGPSARILTDGVHVCLADDQGRLWFFRLLPPFQGK